MSTTFADIVRRNIGDMLVGEIEDPITDLTAFATEPFDVYQNAAKFHVSSHLLKDFRQSPLLFQRKRLGYVVDKDRKAYRFGRATHVLTLEGKDAFAERYAVGGPTNPKTGKRYGEDSKAFAEWEAKQNKECLTEVQALQICWMANSVWSHKDARPLLEEGWPELVVRANYAGHSCQGRLDWLNPRRGIPDLKTCDNLDFFEMDTKRFGYEHQLAFYRALVRIKTGRTLPCFLIGIEKQEPYRAGVWRLSGLDKAEAENEQALRDLQRCLELNVWPTGYEEMRTL